MIDVDEKSFEQIVAEAFDETEEDDYISGQEFIGIKSKVKGLNDDLKNAISKLYFAYNSIKNNSDRKSANLGMAYISAALFYLTKNESWKQNANDCYKNSKQY